MAGADGTILHFDGKAITTPSAVFPGDLKPNLHGIWGSAANDVWVVGDGVILHFTGWKEGAP
jgi:hypothetical protein